MSIKFIELTRVSNREKFILNISDITEVNQSKVAGCSIIINRDADRPIAVVEPYNTLKAMLLPHEEGYNAELD